MSDSNVVEGNGVLQLITEVGGGGASDFTSGMIHTRETFSQTYGWFEARLKDPPGAGMYTTFWMLAFWPETYHEIDIAEWRGTPNTVDMALNLSGPNGVYSDHIVYDHGPDFTADFHTYAVNWQPDSITYYVDGVQFLQVTDNVPQTPMWILLNSGIGGPGWGGGTPDPSSLPNSMLIQYVRVWQGGGTTPPVHPLPPSPNGSVIRAGQGGSLITSEGTWTFGGLAPDGVNSYTQLDGIANGWAVKLEIANGNLYAFNQIDGDWWLRQNSSWVDVGPTGPGGGANLIQDPNYTQQPQGNGNGLIAPWYSNGPAMIGLDGDNGNGPPPTPCGFICDFGTGAWSDITQTISVNPNTNYTLSCFVQTDAVFPAQGLMGAYYGNGTILASSSFGQMTDYTRLTVTFNSGSNTSVVVFAGFSDEGPGAWIHVDNWTMQ